MSFSLRQILGRTHSRDSREALFPPPSYSASDLKVSPPTATSARCGCHARYLALASAVTSIVSKYNTMPKPERETAWWAWTMGHINSMHGIVLASNTACPGNDDCVCHEEYSLLRGQITKLYEREMWQRKQFGEEKYGKGGQRMLEGYISEVKLLKGMCRKCDVVRVNEEVRRRDEEMKRRDEEMRAMKSEIDGLMAEIGKLRERGYAGTDEGDGRVEGGD